MDPTGGLGLRDWSSPAPHWYDTSTVMSEDKNVTKYQSVIFMYVICILRWFIYVLWELTHCQRQLESQRRQLAQSEQTCADLRRRDADTREAIAAKDAQIAVLRTRLDEADRELAIKSKQLSDLGSTQDRYVLRLVMHWQSEWRKSSISVSPNLHCFYTQSGLEVGWIEYLIWQCDTSLHLYSWLVAWHSW